MHAWCIDKSLLVGQQAHAHLGTVQFLTLLAGGLKGMATHTVLQVHLTAPCILHYKYHVGHDSRRGSNIANKKMLAGKKITPLFLLQ